MSEPELNVKWQILPSLEKVFPDSEIECGTAGKIPVFAGARGETVAFQIAFRSPTGIYLKFRMESGLNNIRMREVCLVPCEQPGDPNDPGIIRSEPGLYPDPLRNIREPLRLAPNITRAVWFSVRLDEKMKPGSYDLKVMVSKYQYPDEPWKMPGGFEAEIRVRIRVHAAVLPKQKFILTNWFYTDCLAEYYHVRIWSRKFWTILENYLRDYAAHGRNMLLTPLWTVPLDTRIGGERPTAQLLEIRYEKGKYHFDFSRLKQWIDLGRKCGIEYFEMSHFFTQWGAEFTPKIIVEVNGRKIRKFGWQVAAVSPEYRDFLAQLMPQLLRFLRAEKLAGKCFFHFSDEPPEKKLENYRRSTAFLNQYVNNDEFPVIDALSSVKYFQEGLVKRPVPFFPHLDDFAHEKLPQKWCYFAGANPGYPARSYGAPLCRYRILGVLLYLYEMDGFLHWGHNFWFTQYSRRTQLDPWKETTAGGCFTGGHIYNVYPEPDGHPADALHYESFMEAMQDLRLLQLLETKIGRKAVVKLIHKGLDHELKMGHFPLDPAYLENLHDAILKKLDSCAE